MPSLLRASNLAHFNAPRCQGGVAFMKVGCTTSNKCWQMQVVARTLVICELVRGDELICWMPSRCCVSVHQTTSYDLFMLRMIATAFRPGFDLGSMLCVFEESWLDQVQHRSVETSWDRSPPSTTRFTPSNRSAHRTTERQFKH